MSVATNTAMGAASATIQAVLRKRNSTITENDNPFPRSLSTALRRKLVKSRKIRIRRA
jgi:hypothetical protein